MRGLAGTVALVTGGAGVNIGSTISSRLGEEGATVIVLDTTANRHLIDATVKSIVDKGWRAEGLPVESDELLDSRSIYRRITRVIEDHGRLDILVNNAGGGGGRRLRDEGSPMTDGLPTAFEATLKSNLTSAFVVTKALLEAPRPGPVSVVFISSVNALVGGFGEVSYSLAKAGLHSLAQTLTAEFGPTGCRFNVVAPGSVIPDYARGTARREPEAIDAQIAALEAEGKKATWVRRFRTLGAEERVTSLYPLGRTGRPDDIAAAVAFLASADASWISGITLPVDGGFSAVGTLRGGDWWEPPHDI